MWDPIDVASPWPVPWQFPWQSSSPPPPSLWNPPSAPLTTLLATPLSILQMWDLRKLKTPVHVFTGLPTTHSETGCCFSPDESLILTGVSAQRDGTGGALLFFDVNK